MLIIREWVSIRIIFVAYYIENKSACICVSGIQIFCGYGVKLCT